MIPNNKPATASQQSMGQTRRLRISKLLRQTKLEVVTAKGGGFSKRGDIAAVSPH